MRSSMRLLGFGIAAALIGIAFVTPITGDPLVGAVGSTLAPTTISGAGGEGAQFLNVKFHFGNRGGSGYWGGYSWGYPYGGGPYYYGPSYDYSNVDPWSYPAGSQICTWNGYGYTCYTPFGTVY